MSSKNAETVKEFLQIRNKLLKENIIDEERLLIENVLIESLRDLLKVKVNLEQYLGENRFKNLLESVNLALSEVRKEVTNLYSSVGLEPFVEEFLDTICDVFEASNLLLENGLLEDAQQEDSELSANKKNVHLDAFVFT